LQRRDSHPRERQFLHITSGIGPGFEIVEVRLQRCRQTVDSFRSGLPLIKIRRQVDEIAEDPPINRADNVSTFIAPESGRDRIVRPIYADQSGTVNPASGAPVVNQRETVHPFSACDCKYYAHLSPRRDDPRSGRGN
jgi:hypothetical protein